VPERRVCAFHTVRMNAHTSRRLPPGRPLTTGGVRWADAECCPRRSLDSSAKIASATSRPTFRPIPAIDTQKHKGASELAASEMPRETNAALLGRVLRVSDHHNAPPTLQREPL
jgi:hypothetical protein